MNDKDEFLKYHNEIYPPELELKLEHHGKSATFLDLHIEIINDKFVYKLFDKRDKFPFHIVRMPDLSSNIPSSIFYGSIMSEFLRIARCTLLIEDFVPRASELFHRMSQQCGNPATIMKQIMKAFNRHNETFLKFNATSHEIINKIEAYK